jgi:hypothetical protein
MTFADFCRALIEAGGKGFSPDGVSEVSCAGQMPDMKARHCRQRPVEHGSADPRPEMPSL